MNIHLKIIYEALICLLNTSMLDCVDKPTIELKRAKKEYIESTIETIERALESIK